MSFAKIFFSLVTPFVGFVLWSFPTCTEEQTKGDRIFRKCSACHFLEKTENKVGPSLKSVVNRKAGTHPGYKFSPEMIEAGKNGLIWNQKNLIDFLENPQKIVRGTRMAPVKISTLQDIMTLLAYIEEMSRQIPSEE